MGGKSVRKSWNASDIEKVLLKERQRRETKDGDKEKPKKSLADAFV